MLIKSLAASSSHIRKQARIAHALRREPSTYLFFPYRSFGGFEFQEQEQKLKSYVKVRTETLICKFII